MKTAADIIALVAGAVSIAFPVTYAARSPWRTNRVGRSLMYTAIALAVLLVNNGASIWFPEYPGRSLVRVLVYGGLVVTLAGLLRTLIKVQNGAPGFVSDLHRSQMKKENAQ